MPSSDLSDLRRFMRGLGGFLLLQMPFVILVICYGRPAETIHYLGAFSDKRERLIQAPGPRLILMGGSNVAFGIDSKLLKRQTGRNPINLGLYAPLGLAYQLNLVRRHGREGDWILIAPEYEMYANRLQPFVEDKVHELFDHAPCAESYFSTNQDQSYRTFFDHNALHESSLWLSRAIDRLRKTTAGKVYVRDSFNRYGDAVVHRDRTCKHFDDETAIAMIDQEGMTESLRLLNQFASECRSRQMKVFLTYAPLPEARQKVSVETLSDLQRRLSDGLDFRSLGSPKMFTYSSDRFFDTYYHLRREATTDRTQQLSRLLTDTTEGQAAEVVASGGERRRRL